MTGARWRKIRADVLSNRLRSALAIVALAVGTTAVGAMVLAGSTVDASLAATFAAADPPSAHLRTSPMSPAVAAEVLDHPAVAQGDARRLHRVQLTAANDELVTVELVAMPDFTANEVARIRPVEGAWPPEAGALVLERASAAELGFAVGDVAVIEVPGEVPVEVAVSGTAFDAYEVAPLLGGSLRAYVSLETMEALTGSGDLDALYLRAASPTAGREAGVALASAVRDDVLTPAGVAITATAIDEPGEHPGGAALSFLTRAMQLLSLLALAVAVGLVVTTVAALLAQQRRQLGVMKAVGATSRQLTLQYLGSVALLSLGAVALSVPASLALGRVVAGFIADLANIELEPLGVPVVAIALQVAVALLLPMVAVVLTVRRACRTTVREAITDRGLGNGVQGGSTSSRFARPTVLAYRNAVRNRLRLGLTVLTVALSGAVVVGVLSTGSALGQLGEEIAGYADYDVALSLTEPVALDPAAGALGDASGVASVEGWLEAQAFRLRPDGTENDDIDLRGIPVGSPSLAPTLLEGRWFDAGDDRAIVINTHLADAEPDLVVGGEVSLEVAGHRAPWRIVGISSTTLVGPVAYVALDDLAAVVDRPGEANLLAVQLASGVDQAGAAEELGALALDVGLPLAGVVTNADVRQGLDDIFGIVVALLLVVGAILAVVAVVGVAGTMTLGVVEQTRELGVLRTLGASTWAVRRMLLLQGLAVAAVGGLLGVALSIPVSLLLGEAIGSTLISAAFPFGFSWVGVGVWMAVAFAIGALGATQPARMAARLTVRDTLAYE